MKLLSTWKRTVFRKALPLTILATAFFPAISTAQNVLVNGALVGNGLYPDLSSAFTAINSGSQTGANISIAILGNTTETSTATLNAGTWNYIGIMPSGARTISGSLTTALIDLNGADRVGFDGLNSGGNSLIIENTLATGTSTIRFINDAHTIGFQNLTIKGANTSTTSGTIFISTGTVTGNDSIGFTNCTIDASGANLPTNCVFSQGSSTAGMENSVINFNNCNIADYFNTATVSCGILASTGNTDWTINNCRFYQSALRTYTTANTHRAIQVSSGNNYTITANTIGYATAAGTGVYSMTSMVATRFIGIELNVGTATASNVQGNTVTAISLGTSSGATTTYGILCGISVPGGSVNIGTTAANTIGSISGTSALTATPTTSQGSIMGIHVGAAGTVVIQNNIIGGFTSVGSTASVAGGVTGISLSGAATSVTITGNTIGNPIADNMRAGTNGFTTGSSIASGINITTLPVATLITNNIIRNFSSYGTGTSGYVRGIWTLGATGNPNTVTIASNTIFNLTTSSASTSITSGQASAAGINISSGTNDVLNGNSIYSIANINTGAVSTYVAGITCGNATNTTVRENTIYDIRNASTGTTATAPPIAAGIVIRSGTTGINIYNNMISLGTGQTTNTAFLGIMANHGSTPDPVDRIYHNTINITGTVASGALNSFGFARTDFTSTARTITIDFRNNIVTNTRSGGTGSHYAIANNFGTTASATGWTANASNYNVLNAAAATVGYWNSALTFSGWQTACAGDGNSYSGITVTYINPASNLHLNMGTTPTVLESGGTTIAMVTNDIDNDIRPGPAAAVNGGGFAPDLGADEFDGVYLDAIAPIITYTPFSFTCSTTDRTFTATITDFTGVNNSGFQPRVYFKKNIAGIWQSSAGSLSSGTIYNGTWTFTISTSAMGGLTAGDVVYYYIIAQDLTSPSFNIGSNPSTGLVATNVNTVTTPPTNPNSYSIGGTLSGTYTVGVGGNFTTLTAAVNAYNTSCLSGPVIFSLIDVTYPTETFPITINSNPNASAVNTLTIKPATGVNATLSGSSATALIVFNGADYVTIDGSNSTTVNSVCPRTTASRNLTITNTNASTSSAVISLQTSPGGDAATNNVVLNSIINGNGSLTTGVAINISGPAIGSGTGANQNSYNTISNNLLQMAQVGIFSSGSAITTKNQNNIYSLNDLNSSGTNALGRVGIMLLYEDAPSVLANNVGNIVNSGTTDVMGISLGYNSIANTSTTGAEVSNGIVSGNSIDNLVQSNTFSSTGISVASAATGTTMITNNIINRVFCNGTAPDFACGIFYGGGTAPVNIYHNTIAVTGTTLTGATQPNMAVGINGSTPTVDLRNNILICTGDNGANANTGVGLGYTSTTGNYANLTSNYNDIIVSGTGSNLARVGSLSAGTTLASLSNWQAETGRDANSVSAIPTFVSATNLHCVAGSNTAIEDAALPIAAVTSDYDCVTRSSCTVDIGADEFGTPREADVTGNSVAIADGDNSPTSADFTDFGTTSVCSGTISKTFVISNPGTTALTISAVTITGANAADFTVSSSPVGTLAAAGTSNLTISFDPSASSLETATVTIVSNDCDEASYDFAIQGTGTQVTSALVSSSNVSCNGGNNGDATVSVSGGMPSLTYAWTPSGGNAATASGLAAGTYTCTVTDGNGCTASQTVTITEPAAITSSTTITDASCNGSTNGSITVTSSGGTGSHSYSWSSGGTAATESGLGAGTYTCTITDANGCTATQTATVNEPAAITSSVSQTDVLCNGQSNGTATVTASGGTGTLGYSWSSGGTAAMESGLAAGSYTCTITDANGCTSSETVTITEPAAFAASLVISTDPTTCGGTDGSIDISVSGGIAPYAFAWSNSATTEDLGGLPAGTYSCTITDPNGCIASIPAITLNDPAPPVVSYADPVDTACQAFTAPFTLSGESPAGGSWTGPGVSGNTFDPLTANLGYNVITYTYTDAITGCSATATDSIWVDICSGTGNSMSLQPISIYPNPNNGEFVVELQQGGTLELLDMLGQVVYSQQVNAGRTAINAIVPSNGVYLIRVSANNGSVSEQKLVIRK
jgi:hypothetical protein